MRIIDKLKKILGIKVKQEQIYLPVSLENNKSAENFKQKYRVEQLSKNPQEPVLEECMSEFIEQYKLQEKINSESGNKSYNAFRRMFCSQEEEIRK